MDYDAIAKKYGGTTNYDEIAKKHGGTTSPTPTTPSITEDKPKSLWQKYNTWAQGDNFLKSFATGSAKQTLTDIQGLGQTVLRGAEMSVNALPFVEVEKGAFGSQEKLFQDPEALKPQGLWENVGGISSKVMQYAATAGPVKAAQNAINMMSFGIKAGKGTNFVQGLFRAWGKSTVDMARTFTLEKLVGGTAEGAHRKAEIAGLTAGVASFVLSAAGEIWRGMGSPKKIVEQVLKDSKKSLDAGKSKEYFERLMREDPTAFRKAVDAGLIKTDGMGNIQLQDQLSVEALNRGIVSSPDNMGYTVKTQLLRTTSEKRELLKNAQDQINISSKQDDFKRVLNTVIKKADDFEIQADDADEARRLLDVVSNNKILNAEQTFDLRVLIDRMLNPRAFSGAQKSILTSLKEKDLMNLRTILKLELDKNPEIAQVMKDQHFYLDTWAALQRHFMSEQSQHTTGIFDFLRKSAQTPLLMTAQGTARPGVSGTFAQTLTSTAGSELGEMFR
jgi:hypothetical protein